MQQVEIRIRGQIALDWSEWFEGFSIQDEGADVTVMRGEIVDQTSLYALINRLSRLGIELISIHIRHMGRDR